MGFQTFAVIVAAVIVGLFVFAVLAAFFVMWCAAKEEPIDILFTPLDSAEDENA